MNGISQRAWDACARYFGGASVVSSEDGREVTLTLDGRSKHLVMKPMEDMHEFVERVGDAISELRQGKREREVIAKAPKFAGKFRKWGKR